MRLVPRIVFVKPYADVYQGSVVFYDAGETVGIGGASSSSMEEAAKLINGEIARPEDVPSPEPEPVIPLTALN